MSGRAVRWALSLLHRPRDRGPRLVIVRHHRVYASGERPLYRLGVSESVLARQLHMLGRVGLVPVTVEEGLERLRARTAGLTVAMTFDDGYADNVTRALPLLEAAGAKATFYLTAGLMEDRRAPWWDTLAHVLSHARRPRLDAVDGVRVDADLAAPGGRATALARVLPALRVAPGLRDARLAILAETLEVREPAPCELATWDQARRLAEAGMEIGAHTLTHPFLSLLPESEQRVEIAGSIERIEQRLGIRARGLAYPGGDHDDVTVAVAESSGLAHAVTTRAGDNGPDAARFRLRRRGLSDGACLAPGGRFSTRLARAELDGAFDGLRGMEAAT